MKTITHPITLGTLVTFEEDSEQWIGHVVAIGAAGGTGCTVRAIPLRQPSHEQVRYAVFPKPCDWGIRCDRLWVLAPVLRGAPATPGSDATVVGDGAVRA